ncbi:MFS transporter [Streptomyces sp. S07_1.15]|uniref:MFS transporter n=1 Tax=Streptomyces sp. S07_1.15 TaxID=2873925 RepID=UPI001D13288D|nr:MFS transporter [Streptomyces sp. S07_1.15]MCC3654886.1 MFS transporter [Streptomyces sp. S07_1.15]
MPEDETRCRTAARPLPPQAGRDAGRPVPGPDAAAGPAVPSDPADPATSGPADPAKHSGPAAPAPSAPPSVWRTRLLIAGIALAALNLRPAITSLGALLEEVRDGLGISGATAGLLTSLPSLCFAVFGVMAPRLAKRGGPAPVLLAGMAAIAAGVLLRPFAGGTAGFLAGSALALAGIALSNVLMPVAVKRWFPDRVGTMTGLYSMTLALGTALAAASAVPAAEAFGGSWRVGLAVWALPALAAVLLWLPLARVRATRRRGRTDGPGAAADRKLPGQREHERTAAGPAPASAPEPEPAPGPARAPGLAPGPADGTARALRITRSPTAWALGCFFGFQSTAAYITMGWLPQIFRDAGLPASTAGALLAVTMGLGVPLSFLLPRIAAGMRHQSALAAALGLSGLLGYAGLYFAPAAGAWAWALLLGISNCAFPLVLTLIGMRSRTTAGVIRLSAFAQSTGYLLSVPGPLLIGVLYQHSGGWGLPLALMSGLMVVQLGLGVRAGRQRYIEDEGRRPLPAGPAARTPAG